MEVVRLETKPAANVPVQNGAQSEYTIEMLNITKRFPRIIANDNITLQLKKGEIHALLGENGAGKSTLMSVLFGLYQAEEGVIKKDGKIVKINDPNDANDLGIGMVHQHFKLVEVFSVLDNIIMGVEPNTLGFLQKKEARKKVLELSEKYGLQVDPDAKIEDITVGMQQRTEILKMLYRDNEILIFDEPTAVLTPQEIKELMQIMKNLKAEGKSILFISHKLNEIMEVADRCTVLRKGKYIGTVDIANTTIEELSRMMVGRNVNFHVEKGEAHIGEEILRIENMTVASKVHKNNAVKNVSLNVHAGEIVCIAGIDGNGQSEFVYGLTGLEPLVSGRMLMRVKNDKRGGENTEPLSKLAVTPDPENPIPQNLAAPLGGDGSEQSPFLYKIGASDVVTNDFLLSLQKAAGEKGANVFATVKQPRATIGIIAPPQNGDVQISVAVNDDWGKADLSAPQKGDATEEDPEIYSYASGTAVPPEFLAEQRKKAKQHDRFTVLKAGCFSVPMRFGTDGSLNLMTVVYTYLNITRMPIRKRNISGMGHIPEDRHKHGLVLDYSLEYNMVLERYFEPEFTNKAGFLRRKNIRKYTDRLIEKFDIRSGQGAITTARSMSGGNQQKAIVAREIDKDPELLVAVQPTRGLDVGAIEGVHKQLVAHRDAGKAVLLVSLELDEVMDVPDRILVMYEGEIVGELDPKQTTQEELGLYMAGAKRDEVVLK